MPNESRIVLCFDLFWIDYNLKWVGLTNRVGYHFINVWLVIRNPRHDQQNLPLHFVEFTVLFVFDAQHWAIQISKSGTVSLSSIAITLNCDELLRDTAGNTIRTHTYGRHVSIWQHNCTLRHCKYYCVWPRVSKRLAASYEKRASVSASWITVNINGRGPLDRIAMKRPPTHQFPSRWSHCNVVTFLVTPETS